LREFGEAGRWISVPPVGACIEDPSQAERGESSVVIARSAPTAGDVAISGWGNAQGNVRLPRLLASEQENGSQ
jgi:hypothetical protein